MPSPETCLSRPPGLSLENAIIRERRDLSHPRCRLALTLPGSDWLTSASLTRSSIETHRPPSNLLCPSWERESASLSVTSPSLMSSNLKLKSSSLLDSKLSLTSNNMLTSEVCLTSNPILNSKLSCSISASSLSCPLLSSEPSCRNLTMSPSAVTSDLLLSNKNAVTPHYSLSSDTLNVHSSLSSTLIAPSKLSLLPNTALSATTSDLNKSFNTNKNLTLQTAPPPGVTLNLDPLSGNIKEEPRDSVSEESLVSQESSSTSTLDEQDSVFDGLASQDPKVTTESLTQSPSSFQTAPPTQEKPKFAEEESVAPINQSTEKLLRQKKMALISAACCSLVNAPNFSERSDATRAELQSLCEEIAEQEPEFVLKVALYTRQELNIRSTANFLLAVSARLPACRPHLRRYFCASVQLPSDWMEIPRLYQSLASENKDLAPLPYCLRRALTMKFLEFSEYQLAKYNTRKQRGKHESTKQKARKPKVSRIVKVGKDLRKLQPALQQLQDQFDSPPPSSALKKSKDKFSLKSLIQRLHISKPANHVMSLLGCRYPKDLISFSRSGLEGPWQSNMSGCRMKLKQPQTWDRELSLKGNTGPIWEGLLDSNKVPFMALLRNLRNLIRAGITERHHRDVTARICNKSAVIKSRLFPFRFLSAYKVIQDLEFGLRMAEEPFPSNIVLLTRIFRRGGKTIQQLSKHRWTRRQLRACLAVSAVHQLLKREKETLRKARAVQLDRGILQSYKKALEKAIDISSRHNIPPLPGRTVILFCVSAFMLQSCHEAKDLSFGDDDSESTRSKSPPTLLEVGLLLSLMVKNTSESADLVLYDDYCFVPAKTSSSFLLQNVNELKKQAEELFGLPRDPSQAKCFTAEYVLELLKSRTKVDTLLIFTLSPMVTEFQTVLQQYRRQVNAECLCVTVLPAGYRNEDGFEKCNDVTLCGFTEQVLRFVSERGTARLLDRVGNVNERFKVPEDPDNVRRNQVMTQESIPHIPKQRWRSIRVFISSTFRDMHAERDLLITRVFPELRARAKSNFLSLEEIDLRWGITEEEAKKDRQLSLCLSEVCRSQIFIGILGERYGYIPKTYSVPLLPEYKWIQTYPLERSITEMEAMQFLQGYDLNAGHPKAFFYLREPQVTCPSHSDFSAESPYAKLRMSDLKKRVTQNETSRCYRYPCQWGSDQHGKPFVTGLEDFEARVLEDIWEVIDRDFIRKGNKESEEDEEQLAQDGFQEWQENLSCARQKLVMSTCTQILERPQKTNGHMFLVCGDPSQGKTVFMASLVKELRLVASSSVIFHFTGASPASQDAEAMLTHVCKQLNLRLQRESNNLTSYRALLDEFQSLLLLVSRSLKRSNTLTLLIDGADLLCGHAGELISDWIPEHLPQRVNLVLSMTEGSSLCSSLHRRKNTSIISLKGLDPQDRAELVRHRLTVYGKKLDESAFNNQMRLLMIKKGCRDPLYLALACEELHTSSVYEKLSDDIQKLPATLPPLIQHRLCYLEQEHGVTMVTIALTCICISQKGLTERDLLRILSLLQHVKCIYTASWDKVLAAAAHAQNLPMANFSLLLRGLRSVLGLCTPTLTSDPRLYLQNGLLRDAVKKRYFGKPEVPRAAHMLMAAHFWSISAPEDPETLPVLHAESLSELSYHLLCSDQLKTLDQLLTHLPFLQAHATLGLLPHLCQIYSRRAMLVSEKMTVSNHLASDADEPQISESTVGEFRDFIHRSLPILSQSPSLLYQMALNEPENLAVCIQAKEFVCNTKYTKHQRSIIWDNKPGILNISSSKSLKIPSTPTCVSLSPREHLATVGTSNGSLHILDTDSGKEVRTLYSSCDGISACTFISDDLLCIASYDGSMEIWNIPDGCRLHHGEAHRRQVTGCYVSNDHKQLLTCSLDYQLKLWDSSRGSLVGSNSFHSPLNCAAFHPRGHVVAVGSWDGKITVLRLDTWKKSAVLCGGSSVRTVSFLPGENVLVSGSLDGWVSLWAWEAQAQLTRFKAHSGSTLTSCFLYSKGHLLTGGEDSKVQVWSGGLGRLRGQIGAESMFSSALSLSVSPSKQFLAVGYHSESVCIYGLDTGGLVSQCGFVGPATGSLLWLSDEILVTGSIDNQIRVWHVSSTQSQCRLTINEHKRSVLSLAASPQFLASASEDASVCLWSVDSLLVAVVPPSPVLVLQGHSAAVTCCSFSNDGRLLATGGQDRSVLCWDVSSNLPTAVHSLLSCHRDWVTGCAWTDTSLLVTCSGDGSVYLWNIQLEERLLEFAGHQSAVSDVLCMGEHVLTVARDGILKVWNLKGTEIAGIQTDHGQISQCAAYWESDTCDDADLVVFTANSDGFVLKWSPLQMDQVQLLCGHGGAVTSSAAGPESKVIVTVSQDGSVRLWGGTCRDGHLTKTRHFGAVTAVAWSPDAQLVVSGGETGDVIVWHEHKAVLTLQCSDVCVSYIYCTSNRSFCAITNDERVSRWILFPRKGGGLRAKKAYTIEVGSLVISAALAPLQTDLQLQTVFGGKFLVKTKTGLMKPDLDPAPSSANECDQQPPQELLHPDCIITASQPGFGVSDSLGGLWLQASDNGGSTKWEQKQVHSASISALHVTDKMVITASADQTLKVWERNPFKQVGLFHCDGAVTCLSVSAKSHSNMSQDLLHIACGDQYGHVYLLSFE
ncbi:telomerase protein component 1 isoform 1-T4 [Discoglossus pictus]